MNTPDYFKRKVDSLWSVGVYTTGNDAINPSKWWVSFSIDQVLYMVNYENDVYTLSVDTGAIWSTTNEIPSMQKLIELVKRSIYNGQVCKINQAMRHSTGTFTMSMGDRDDSSPYDFQLDVITTELDIFNVLLTVGEYGVAVGMVILPSEDRTPSASDAVIVLLRELGVKPLADKTVGDFADQYFPEDIACSFVGVVPSELSHFFAV